MQGSVQPVRPAAHVPLAVPFLDGTLQHMELEAWVSHKTVAKRQVGRKIAVLYNR